MIWPIDMGVGPMSSIYDSFLKGGKRSDYFLPDEKCIVKYGYIILKLILLLWIE